jgi:histidinol dehydrogenase
MHSSLRRGLGPGVLIRDRPLGRIVYPVVSRRSGGLSLGVDLFPDAKDCNFDCPYCEVFLPSREKGGAASSQGNKGASSGGGFSPALLEAELREFAEVSYGRDWAPEPVRDICFSGSGEPSSSPFLAEALEACAAARRAHPEVFGSSSLVLITNSTGFLDSATSELLLRAAREEGLVVWAKLDAGSEELFRLMSGTEGSLEAIAGGILSFSRRASVVVQTMLCEVEGRSSSDEELRDYGRLLSRLRGEGARIDEVHLYTFARPTPSHACAPLSDERLGRCAAELRERTGLRVRAFGRREELELPGGPLRPSPQGSGR